MKPLYRTLHPEIRTIDEAKGLVEYIASDETLDSYREVIRSNGWRFDSFAKNAPFVDSHNYYGIGNQLGKVVEFGVVKKKLVETVQWAIDVPTNTMALHGFNMTKAGYLKAVSVGFHPVRTASMWDADPREYAKQLSQLGYDDESDKTRLPRVIYLEQQQIELSAVLIGANPNALAKAYKAGILDDAAIDFISDERTKRNNARVAAWADLAARARDRHREEFVSRMEKLIGKL